MKTSTQSWYNYKTGEWEERDAPQTDEEAVNYIPQQAGVAMYHLLREYRGLSIPEAMLYVLSVAVGETP